MLETNLVGSGSYETSHLGTAGFLYPCVWPSVSPPCYYSELGAVDKPNGSALNWYRPGIGIWK